MPPKPEKPPKLPSDLTTRWQGIISKWLFCPHTLPTYLGEVFKIFAISPYVLVEPYLIKLNWCHIFFCNGVPTIFNLVENFFLLPLVNSRICFLSFVKRILLPLFFFLPNSTEEIWLFSSLRVIHPKVVLKLSMFLIKSYKIMWFFQSY